MFVQWKPIFWFINWNPDFVVMRWVFNMYCHKSIGGDYMCITTSSTTTTTRIHNDSVTWYRPPFQPVGKGRPHTTCIRDVEAFIQMLTKSYRLFDSICGECIFQFSWDQHSSPHNTSSNGSLECGVWNLIQADIGQELLNMNSFHCQ